MSLTLILKNAATVATPPAGKVAVFVDESGLLQSKDESGTVSELGGGGSGNQLRSGAGAPSSGLGTDGDFYINTSANTLYGPKTSGSWGSPTSIVGPAGSDGADGSDGTDGSDGADGSVTHAGSGAPSDVLGVDGDYYINTDNGDYYGPKASGTWTGTTILNIVGEPGPQGSPGAGVNWQGPWDTDSSYAVDDAVEFNGSAYICNTAADDTEPDPETSAKWDLWVAKGTDGADGSPGFAGDLIVGSGDPDDGADGVDGQIYFDYDTGNLWGPKISGDWGASPSGSLAGADGSDGADGTDGTDGADGEDGLGTKQDVSISSGTLTIDYTAGRVVYVPLNANITTLTINNWPTTGTFGKLSIRFTADGTGRTISWPAAFDWDGGTPPTPPSTNGHRMWVHIVSADALTTADVFLGSQAIQ